MYLIVNKKSQEPELAPKLKQVADFTGIPYDNLAYKFSRQKKEKFVNDDFWIHKAEDSNDAVKLYAGYVKENRSEGDLVGSVLLPDGGKSVNVYLKDGTTA